LNGGRDPRESSSGGRGGESVYKEGGASKKKTFLGTKATSRKFIGKSGGGGMPDTATQRKPFGGPSYAFEKGFSREKGKLLYKQVAKGKVWLRLRNFVAAGKRGASTIINKGNGHIPGFRGVGRLQLGEKKTLQLQWSFENQREVGRAGNWKKVEVT